MQLDEFQQKAGETAIYPGQGVFLGLIYCTLGLAGEAGELCNKVKKLLRDDGLKMSEELSHKQKYQLAKELGDGLWYVAKTAKELHLSLSTIAEINLAKLKVRQENGTLGGSGDDR